MNKLTFDKQTKVYNIISKYFRNHHKIGGRHTAIVVYSFIYNLKSLNFIELYIIFR